MFGLVNVSFSLPGLQAVKMTFFAPGGTGHNTKDQENANQTKDWEYKLKSHNTLLETSTFAVGLFVTMNAPAKSTVTDLPLRSEWWVKRTWF